MGGGRLKIKYRKRCKVIKIREKGGSGLQAVILGFHSFCTGKLLLNYILVFACATYFLSLLVKALNPNLRQLVIIFSFYRVSSWHKSILHNSPNLQFLFYMISSTEKHFFLSAIEAHPVVITSEALMSFPD